MKCFLEKKKLYLHTNNYVLQLIHFMRNNMKLSLFDNENLRSNDIINKVS